MADAAAAAAASAPTAHPYNIMDDPNNNDSEYFVPGDVDRVIVSGAGEEAVNGEYVKEPFRDRIDIYVGNGESETGRFVFFKHGVVWKGELQSFFIYRWDDPHSDDRTWEIGCRQRWSRTSMTDFYRVVLVDEKDFSKRLPPANGWTTRAYSFDDLEWNASGEDPPPVLAIKYKPLGVKTEPTAKPVARTYSKLLLSDTFSDVKIVCNDGQVLAAHKSILAESSPYFMAAFTGDWKEKETGELKVEYPARIMKQVLTLLYTGNLGNIQLVKDEPLPFISIAAEFHLEWLRVVAEPWCIRDLDGGNKLKQVWQTGRTFDNPVLKQACVDYAKSNSEALRANSDFAHLKIDDPAAWQEFEEAIMPE